MLLVKHNDIQDKRLNCLDNDYLDELHQTYVEAYSYLGLSLSAFSGEELKKKYDGVLIYAEQAYFVYTNTAFGRKISLLFSKPTKIAKRLLVQKYIELIKQGHWYIEASARIEQISSQVGLPYIEKKEEVEAIINKKIYWIGQGYYCRKLSKADEWVVKRIYGYPQTIVHFERIKYPI